MSTEEFDSGWQKHVWDFAIVGNQLNESKYVLNGPIDYRYCLNYGIVTQEHFNCCAFQLIINNNHSNNIINASINKDRIKKIEIEIQYFWYQNNESWHFAKDFYPSFIEVYKYNNRNRNIKNRIDRKKEIYEMALLMDSNRKYKKILSGPVIYETLWKNVCFNELQPYIKGDIKVLRKYGQCVKKIQANKFFSIVNENTPNYAIEFNFEINNKVELWNINYDKKHKWEHYKSEQKEEKYDIVFITNTEKRIKYILNNVIMNCIEQVIKFTSYQEYQAGDYKQLQLNSIAIKIKGFDITNYKFWLDGDKNPTNFIGLKLYETIRYKNFVFPNKMKPFKAFLYRFESLQKKYEWKQYKGAHDMHDHDKWQVSLVKDDFENIHYLPTNNNNNKHKHIRMDSNLQIIHNEIEYDINTLDIKSPSIKSVIHPMILSPGPSIKSPKYNSNNNISNEMIVNVTFANDGWILTPKQQTLTSNFTFDLSINGVAENKEMHMDLLSPKKQSAIAKQNAYIQLTESPYFKGEIKLPKINIISKEIHNENRIIEVWDFYIQKYGFAPDNASQLMKFSKYSPDVNALKYVEAREQFTRRKK